MCVFPELKGVIKNKMREINELKQMGENQGEAQKQAVERAEEILQKYKKIATISQNVLRVRVCVGLRDTKETPSLQLVQYQTRRYFSKKFFFSSSPPPSGNHPCKQSQLDR